MLDMLGLSVATRQERDHVEWGSWICKAVVRQGKMVSWMSSASCSKEKPRDSNTKGSRRQGKAHKGNRAVEGGGG